ncbi:MAG: MBL fold metallo-hydrolase, partial [Pseudomonadota bacterium]
MHKPIVAVVTIALALLTSGLVSIAKAQEERTLTTTTVADGLYMIEGAVGNIGVLTGPDGVVLIDDGLEPVAQQVLDTVRTLTGAEVDFVVNTHLHRDHTGGNVLFKESGATMIAHDNIRRRMIADAEKDGSQPAKAALPELTFSESATFHLNGREAFVFHLPHA